MKLYLNEGESVTVVRNHVVGSHAVVVGNWGGELLGVREFCEEQPLKFEKAEAHPSTTAETPLPNCPTCKDNSSVGYKCSDCGTEFEA